MNIVLLVTIFLSGIIKGNNIKKSIIFPLFLLCSVLFLGCSQQIEETASKDRVNNEVEVGIEEKNEENIKTEQSDLKKEEKIRDTVNSPANREATVHFIDVGQGDATLLMGPDFTVLIDAGRHDQNGVVPYIKKQGVSDIDLIVGTHPHSDHIGQIDKVIEAFSVKEVWLSGDSHTSKTFERVLNTILDNEIDYYEPRTGDEFQIGSLHIQILSPDKLTGDLNAGSISLIATYGEVLILFTGDAEQETEKEILRKRLPVKAQIMKLGHHGSSTSNTKSFLEAVDPEIAIYSAGADNSYGHPHREIIERVTKMNIPIYGTILNGSIVITTDGSTFSIDATNKTTLTE